MEHFQIWKRQKQCFIIQLITFCYVCYFAMTINITCFLLIQFQPKSNSLKTILATMCFLSSALTGNVMYDGRDPKSCLGQVFNLKLDSFAQWQFQCMAYTWSLLELKTQPRFCPVKWVCPLLNKCMKTVQKWNFFKFESRQKQCLIIQFIWKPLFAMSVILRWP